jgi:pyruvyltransferase
VGSRLADTAARTLDVRGEGWLPGALLASPRLPKPVPAFWWGSKNFGDSLSKIVISHVSGLVPIHVSNQYSGKVLGIGSILHHALAEKDVVWGSGAIRNEPIDPPRDTQFLAVRGPWTQSLIRADVPSVFGDPSILLPGIHRPNPGPRYSVGVVPHYVDRPYVTIADPSVLLIDVSLPWRRVVDLIARCDMILSSSLHGLIVAESYGIPAAWITISDRIVGGTFKFNDYLLGTGRSEREPVPWERGFDAMVRGAKGPPPLHDGTGLRQAWLKWWRATLAPETG